MGWNIFPWFAVATVLLAVVASVLALCNRRVATLVVSSMAVAVLTAFVAMLWLSLERPPMRTMGETRLWYSFFLLVAGVVTYARWRFRWVLSFSTMLSTVFILSTACAPNFTTRALCRHCKVRGLCPMWRSICSPMLCLAWPL